MSSDPQSALKFLILNNYASLVLISAVVYDYVLTLSSEIQYVWTLVLGFYNVSCRPLYRSLLDYVGAYSSGLVGSSFFPGPLEVSRVIFVLSGWTYIVFLSAADWVMILRVYAMWNRSRTILYVLLSIYMVQIVTTVALRGIYNNPDTHLSVSIIQVPDFSVCNTSFVNIPAIINAFVVIPRFVLGVTLMILAVFQTLKESFVMYRATKHWQPNRYIRQLVGDGILYFVVNLLYQINDALGLVGLPINNTSVFLDTFTFVIFYTLIPRFILGIRELYDRDVRGRVHVDTGFGVLSQPSAGLDATMSAIVFVDTNQGPEVEGGQDNLGNLETGQV